MNWRNKHRASDVHRTTGGDIPRKTYGKQAFTPETPGLRLQGKKLVPVPPVTRIG